MANLDRKGYALRPCSEGIVTLYDVLWNGVTFAHGVKWREARDLIAEHMDAQALIALKLQPLKENR